MMSPNRLRHPLALQATLLAFGVALLAAPPADGSILLVPVAGRPIPVADVTRPGVLLLGKGPMAGSLIVRGPAATLAGPMLRHGVLLFAAPRGGCDTGEAGRA